MFSHANFSIDTRSLCKDFVCLSVVWFYALLEYIAVVSKLLECLGWVALPIDGIPEVVTSFITSKVISESIHKATANFFSLMD